MSQSSPLHLPVHARCFATITQQAPSRPIRPWHHNSSQPYLQRSRDTLRCGINDSDPLVFPTTRYYSCVMFHQSGSLMQQQQGVPEEFTVSGTEWFRRNNFTALPILLVNPVALYGYGDINIVPAVRHYPSSTYPLQGSCMQILTRD